nr:DUF5908 family protein [uncultured Psychroserpens sp.]
MPLQIKELHIKVSVNGGENTDNANLETTGAVSNAVSGNTQNNADIISKCVEQVLEILKEKLEP